jgi:hypothetical protein
MVSGGHPQLGGNILLPLQVRQLVALFSQLTHCMLHTVILEVDENKNN